MSRDTTDNSDTTVNGDTTEAEANAPSAENLEISKVLSFKPGVGQNIAFHARNSTFLMPADIIHSASFIKSSLF